MSGVCANGVRTLLVATLRHLAGAVWLAGSAAGFVCTFFYRLAGRINGLSYEIQRQGGRG
jgi:hypothetical protein